MRLGRRRLLAIGGLLVAAPMHALGQAEGRIRHIGYHSAIATPMTAKSQPRLPRIGVLSLLAFETDRRVQAVVIGLRERGYVEGKSIAIDRVIQ